MRVRYAEMQQVGKNCQTRYPCPEKPGPVLLGYGYGRVRVRVSYFYPRVTRDIHYSLLLICCRFLTYLASVGLHDFPHFLFQYSFPNAKICLSLTLLMPFLKLAFTILPIRL